MKTSDRRDRVWSPLILWGRNFQSSPFGFFKDQIDFIFQHKILFPPAPVVNGRNFADKSKASTKQCGTRSRREVPHGACGAGGAPAGPPWAFNTGDPARPHPRPRVPPAAPPPRALLQRCPRCLPRTCREAVPRPSQVRWGRAGGDGAGAACARRPPPGAWRGLAGPGRRGGAGGGGRRARLLRFPPRAGEGARPRPLRRRRQRLGGGGPGRGPCLQAAGGCGAVPGR